MALSITNPLSSIHIDPNFRFYKLSIKQKKIIPCDDDKEILNYFRCLDYMHCSLCLTQEQDSIVIFKHLKSETHALNGMRSKNFVGFLVVEISALIICPREHINYLFYLNYNKFPFEQCLGIADDRFITIMNKDADEMKMLPEEYEFSTTLGDFNLEPENIGTRLTMTVMIQFGHPSTKMFPRNFLLYELKYSLMDDVKYVLKTGDTWNYLRKNTTTPQRIVCSCTKVFLPPNFIEHCRVMNYTCTLRAAIYCHLCKTVFVYSSADFLTHTHYSEIDLSTLIDDLIITRATFTIDKFDLKKIEKSKIQQVSTSFKIKPDPVKKKQVNKKFPKRGEVTVSLSKSIFGEIKKDAVQYKRLLDKFKVYVYNLSTKEHNIYQVDEIPKNYDLLFLVCCVCMKICQSSLGISSHFKGPSHLEKVVVCPPVGLYFPEVGGLVIGNLEDFNYLQHILFVGMPLLSNIIVGDCETLVIIFYNTNFKKHITASNLRDIVYNNIKTSLGHDNNYKVRFIQLILNSDVEPAKDPNKFIIFEFFNSENEESNEVFRVNNLDQFFLGVQGHTFSCLPCGLKRIKYDDFSKHIKANHCFERSIGLICHKCMTFTIHSFQECLRHCHNDLTIRHERITQHKEHIEHVSNGDVKKVEISLLEKIDIKEYFDTINKVCTSDEVSNVETLTNYLLNGLTVRSNVNNVGFLCNICEQWTCYRINDMTDHVDYHKKIKENTKEEYGGLCDICSQFLFDRNPNILEDHIKTKHPGYTKQENDFQLVQNENGITINIISSFSYNLLQSFVEKISNCLNFECNDITVFCVVCLKTFQYSFKNFHDHVMDSSHQPQTTDQFAAYCTFCKLLLYHDDVRLIANHFNYHSHLIKSDISTIDELDTTSVEEDNVEEAVMKDISLFSCCHARGKNNKLVLSEFQFKKNVLIPKLFIKLRNMFDRKELIKFHFKCLNCLIDGFTEEDCNGHFLTDFHRLEHNSDMCLVTVCRACSVVLFSLSSNLLAEHFDSGSHFMNAVLEDIGLKENELKAMKDLDRNFLGYLTKQSEETFSSKDSYDCFLEENLVEYKRTERGLPNLSKSLTNDFQRVLDGAYPKAVISFFGSRVSGLAKIKSDIDVYVDFGSTNIQRIVPLFSMIPGLFQIKQVILGAKVPIIKLEHKNTGLSCDICCRDAHGIYNTHLIKFYVNLDERVYQLCATVLEWAKTNGIRGSPKFTSYSLTWMMLFFLMQPEINVIPSVKWLQEHFSGDPVLINGWNCSFLDDATKVSELIAPLTNKTSTLYELIYKFFKYYGSLKADSVILFPYTGELISTQWLLKSSPDKVPENLRNIFFYSNGDKIVSSKTSAYRIIDPFIHDCNIVQNIRRYELTLFQSLCVHTLKCLHWVNLNS